MYAKYTYKYIADWGDFYKAWALSSLLNFRLLIKTKREREGETESDRLLNTSSENIVLDRTTV